MHLNGKQIIYYARTSYSAIHASYCADDDKEKKTNAGRNKKMLDSFFCHCAPFIFDIRCFISSRLCMPVDVKRKKASLSLDESRQNEFSSMESTGVALYIVPSAHSTLFIVSYSAFYFHFHQIKCVCVCPLCNGFFSTFSKIIREPAPFFHVACSLACKFGTKQ